MSVVGKSNQDIKMADSIESHPKFKKVMNLMKGETVKTTEKLLFEVISNCRKYSKVTFNNSETFIREPKKLSKNILP